MHRDILAFAQHASENEPASASCSDVCSSVQIHNYDVPRVFGIVNADWHGPKDDQSNDRPMELISTARPAGERPDGNSWDIVRPVYP